MSNLILFNKPYGVICQFKPIDSKITLAKYIKTPNFYPAGRLDEDSEGLVLLTDDGKLQHRIAHPKHKLAKTYWVQVEGQISNQAMNQLRQGIDLKDGLTRPATVNLLHNPPLDERVPPVRFRAKIPTSWISLTITEGRNRQVRRMTAAAGFPTLRLFRHQIGHWTTDNLPVGQQVKLQVNLPRVR